MELFELKYFLGVARVENIHRASEKLKVSPASLSKAISRLEEELGVKLFSREGRNIALTDHGRLLRERASEIVRLEEAARTQVSGHKGAIHCVIAGSEVLLSDAGLKLARDLLRKYPKMTFEYHASEESVAVERVARGEAHLGLITGDAPAELASKSWGATSFQSCVGEGHPLHAAARAGKSLPVEFVLEHAFVSPSHAFLGQVGLKQSADGWRDDRFPRKIGHVTSSLSLLEHLVLSGAAIAYLPDYVVKRMGAQVLKITGCPYSCSQKIKLLAREPSRVGWIHQLF